MTIGCLVSGPRNSCCCFRCGARGTVFTSTVSLVKEGNAAQTNGFCQVLSANLDILFTHLFQRFLAATVLSNLLVHLCCRFCDVNCSIDSVHSSVLLILCYELFYQICSFFYSIIFLLQTAHQICQFICAVHSLLQTVL